MPEPLTINPAWVVVILAVVAGINALAVAGMQGFLQARKERRDAELQAVKEKRDADAKSKEKAEDYARQDAVAEKVATAASRAADAAELLLKAQAATIARTDEVARLAAEADTRVQEQLRAIDEQGRKIHILVNSDMTAARTNERDSTTLLLVSLKQVQALKTKMAVPITKDESDAIENAEKRIEELNQILADRHAAQLAVDAESKAFGTSATAT